MTKLIYAHDAGPANILACNYRYVSGCLWFARGPALKIFHNASSGNLWDALDSLIKGDSVILGTSIIDQTHLDIISFCKQRDIYTSCCLEHWKNYLDRFSSNSTGSLVLPDRLLVYDYSAYRLAMSFEEIRRSCKIIVDVNYYRIGKINSISRAYLQHSSRARSPLFISEPASVFNTFGAPDEHDSFNCLLQHLFRDGSFMPREIIVCMHPSDLPESTRVYTRIADSIGIRPTFCRSIDTVDFSRVSGVYGRDSMALELTAEAGIPTFTVFRKTSPFSTLACDKLGYLSLL